MRYYLDTEFNEFGGDLISLALVREDGQYLYLATDCPSPGAWVAQNVLPIVTLPSAVPTMVQPSEFGGYIAGCLQGDPDPVIVADWPDDIRYLCAALITGPGMMVNIPGMKFELRRVESYPTTLSGAVQHNALWDAFALRQAIAGAD